LQEASRFIAGGIPSAGGSLPAGVLAGIPRGTGAMEVDEHTRSDSEPSWPSGLFGFLSRLRDEGIIAKWPGGWAKVFMALYSRRNPQGFAWPSQATLAKDAGVNKRTVRRFLRWAKIALGIRITRTRYSKYYLPLDPHIDPFLCDRALLGRKEPKKPRQKAEKRTAETPQRTAS
jgi:hypothetical protein